jgi:hypothetical protein
VKQIIAHAAAFAAQRLLRNTTSFFLVQTRFTTVTIDHRSGPGIWVDMTTYWSYRLSANESAIRRRILKQSD